MTALGLAAPLQPVRLCAGRPYMYLLLCCKACGRRMQAATGGLQQGGMAPPGNGSRHRRSGLGPLSVARTEREKGASKQNAAGKVQLSSAWKN